MIELVTASSAARSRVVDGGGGDAAQPASRAAEAIANTLCIQGSWDGWHEPVPRRRFLQEQISSGCCQRVVWRSSARNLRPSVPRVRSTLGPRLVNIAVA